MIDPIYLVAAAAIAVLAFAAGRFAERFNRPEAVKARMIARAMDSLKSLEALAPNGADLAAAAAREKANIEAIKAEADRLAA